MYYYLLHKLIHEDDKTRQEDPNYPHGAKNVQIFIIGSILYVFSAAFLFSKQYMDFVNSFFFLVALRDWFACFLIIDIIAVGILYKIAWSRSILSEVDETFNDVKKAASNFKDISGSLIEETTSQTKD
jgi:hypothetical protein